MKIEERILQARKNENSSWHKPQVGKYHASSIYDICRYPSKKLETFFERDTFDDATIMVFLIGQMYHDFIQSFYPKECREKKVCIDVEGQCEIVGRVDLLLQEIPVELKTCGTFPSSPYPAHMYQIMCYLHALQKPRGLITYILKDPKKIESKDFQVQYDRGLMNEIQKKVLHFDKLLKIKENI